VCLDFFDESWYLQVLCTKASLRAAQSTVIRKVSGNDAQGSHPRRTHLSFGAQNLRASTLGGTAGGPVREDPAQKIGSPNFSYIRHARTGIRSTVLEVCKTSSQRGFLAFQKERHLQFWGSLLVGLSTEAIISLFGFELVVVWGCTKWGTCSSMLSKVSTLSANEFESSEDLSGIKRMYIISSLSRHRFC
jgi:hypothetical protein